MYRVEWIESALTELAAVWTSADSALRSAITAAAWEIDEQLRTNPAGRGESRPENRRILFVPPLGIYFRVESDDACVTVFRVWLYRKLNP